MSLTKKLAGLVFGLFLAMGGSTNSLSGTNGVFGSGTVGHGGGVGGAEGSVQGGHGNNG